MEIALIPPPAFLPGDIRRVRLAALFRPIQLMND
jgi:hypothetical protein